MKSAYEIAMEKLDKSSGPTRKLSDEQKEHIAEIDRKYDAQLAEQKLSFETKIAAAVDHEQLTALQAEQSNVVASLEAKREKEKDSVWNSD